MRSDGVVDFRNKNDTKVTVVHFTFKQGAIEFLRLKGEPAVRVKNDKPEKVRIE